jgi:hypothetical protein
MSYRNIYGCLSFTVTTKIKNVLHYRIKEYNGSTVYFTHAMERELLPIICSEEEENILFNGDMTCISDMKTICKV